MSSGAYKYMRVQPSLYPNSMEIRMMVSYTLFVYILRGASSLLVLTYRVMRRPQDVERVTGHSPRFFVYICILISPACPIQNIVTLTSWGCCHMATSPTSVTRSGVEPETPSLKVKCSTY